MNDDFNIDDIQLVKRTAPAKQQTAADTAQHTVPESEKEPLLTLSKKRVPQADPVQRSVPDHAPESAPAPLPDPVQAVAIRRPQPPSAPAVTIQAPPPPEKPAEIKNPEKKVPQINLPLNKTLKKPEVAEKKDVPPPVFDEPEMEIGVKPSGPAMPPPQVKGKAVPPKSGKDKSLLPGKKTACNADKPKNKGMLERNYGLGCCIFAFVVPLLLGTGIAATIRYWEPLREQLAKFEAWMVDKGLAFDGGDAPWKHQSENNKANSGSK